MSANRSIPRRTFLRGMGTAIALPLLEAMTPLRGFAAGPSAELPKRVAFLFVPNGMHMPDWTPVEYGGNYEMPPILQPLEPIRDRLLVISGLAHDKARANGDGPGDHARAVATFLTGEQARKTSGKDIRIGVSVDQVAAQQVGHLTEFASLELGCEVGSMSGSCDSGYSCAYSSNMSWRTEATPMPKEVNPKAVFNRLFSDGSDENDKSRSRRDKHQLSILDFALEDAKRLQATLGQTDRRKVEEYLDSIRSIEQRISGASAEGQQESNDLGFPRPKGVPSSYAEHVRLMGDLMTLAFQMDKTRIVTFMLANAGSNRSYREIEVREGHHSLSHHGKNIEKQLKISKINHFHIEQFAYMLKKLKDTPEGDGNLLDQSMIVYGSGIGDGDRHNHDDLPILVAGRGGGTIDSGRHVRLLTKTPLMNLYLSLVDRMGVEVDALGDSTGRLEELNA